MTELVTDEVLAQKVQGGDHASFAELMERYQEKLIWYGRRFLARDEDVEDVVQDVFLKTYENIQSYNPAYAFSPWIYRIAHNAFVNMLRKTSKESFQFIDFDTIISPYTNKEEAKDVEMQLAQMEEKLALLKPKYREVLILHYFDLLSYDEIAEILQIPIGTVGVRLRRARISLKKLYEEQ